MTHPVALITGATSGIGEATARTFAKRGIDVVVSASIPMLNYIFRKPKFPIICDFDGIVVAAKSELSFTRQLDKLEIDIQKQYPLISVSGEGWMFLPQHLAVSPLSAKKKWFKKDIIALYNGRKNPGSDRNQYSDRSLSAKRFEKIFKDIVELLLKS